MEQLEQTRLEHQR